MKTSSAHRTNDKATGPSMPVPQHWSAEQAMAVWECLEELARLIWDRYEDQLVELIESGRMTTWKASRYPAASNA